MRKSIFSVTALALALGFSASVMAAQFSSDSNAANLIQGSSVQAGSVSGATTTGTGFAGTYGTSNMAARTTGVVRSGATFGSVAGTTIVTGRSESGTLVEGLGAAGSITGGQADANLEGQASYEKGTYEQFTIFGFPVGPQFNQETTDEGNADMTAGSNGSSWAATGSIGAGEGVSVNGFEAEGDASAKANGNGPRANSVVTTNSSATSYTLETGNALGETQAIGFGLAGADAFRVHTD